MEFRTPVDLPKTAPRIGATSRVMLLGSCFADSVGQRLATALPEGQVCVNPFGTLYNPESLRLALEILLEGSLFFPDNYLFLGRDELWHSWLHSSRFSAAKREDCARQILETYNPAADLLHKADVLIVTFGTNRAYLHRTLGTVVGNCHKEVPQTFLEQSLSVGDIVTAWQPLLEELQRELPQLQVVFTVSPYRYQKYGLHGSQLAKATLLLAVDALCAANKNACYFPAYEIVTDELRDYRFFEPDMLHPTAQAADYVWQRFRDWTFSPEAVRQAAKLEKDFKQSRHRPLSKA